MFGFFKKDKTRYQVTLIEREPFKLTLTEWRSNPDMAAQAAKVLANPTMKFMLQVLYNSSPAWETLLAPTMEDRAAQQARIEGYAQALANIEAMAVYERPMEHLEQTFEKEESAVNE